ncbi:MAG: restriction endonuclease subunit S, partial [Alphaproteobacteria bacterium]|nr:restriction endonuclease subunit S [Alphaproteobacteria bacterium]
MIKNELKTPTLRFLDFTSDWENKKLGDVADFVGGGTPDSSIVEYWNGGVLWYTPTELKSKFIGNSKRTISKLGLEKSSAKLLPSGTILFSSRATIGDVSIIKKQCATNQGIQSFIVKQKNNNEFIYYWILNNKNYFIRLSSGSTFLEISKNEIKKLKIKIPSMEEQNKIAVFLSSVDKRIDLLQQKHDTFIQYKNALMQGLFPQKGQTNPSMRLNDKNNNPFT